MALDIYFNSFVDGTPIFSSISSVRNVQRDTGYYGFLDKILPIFLQRLKDRNLLKFSKTGDTITLGGVGSYGIYSLSLVCADGTFDSKNYNLFFDLNKVGYLYYSGSTVTEQVIMLTFQKTYQMPSGYCGYVIPDIVIPPDIKDFDWKTWAITQRNKVGAFRYGDELVFHDGAASVKTVATGTIIGGTIGFNINGVKYWLEDIISGKVTAAMLGKTYAEGMAKCTGLFVKVGTGALALFTGAFFATLCEWLAIGGLIYISAKFLRKLQNINTKFLPGDMPYWATPGTQFTGDGTSGIGLVPGGGGYNFGDWAIGGWIPGISQPGVDPNDPTVAGDGVGGTSGDDYSSALAKQNKYYQAMSDFYSGQSQDGKNFNNYYARALEVAGLDSKIKAYESLNIDNGKNQQIVDKTIDDLNKRIAATITEDGIYMGGERIPATVTPDGIVMGGTRIPATITKDGIVMTGTGSGTTTDVNVNVNADAIAAALAGTSVTVDTSALEALLSANKLELGTSALAEFLAGNKIELNTAPLSEIIANKLAVDASALDGKKISIDVEGVNVGLDTTGKKVGIDTTGVKIDVDTTGKKVVLDTTGVTVGLEAGSKVSIDTSSLTALEKLAQNSTAKETRETIQETRQKAIDEQQKKILDNEVDNMSKTNDILGADHKYKTQVVEEKDYAGQKAKAFTDLHSGTLKEWLDVQGNALNVPVGAVGMLAGALPQILNEIWTRVSGKNLADVKILEEINDRMDGILGDVFNLHNIKEEVLPTITEDSLDFDKDSVEWFNEVQGVKKENVILSKEVV